MTDLNPRDPDPDSLVAAVTSVLLGAAAVLVICVSVLIALAL